ncbi:hypothetical protein AKO1_007258 [Acrasis kona]|uniref:Uncharacterized protein n=1 Tax=Acrasis kona TaxID=1008807 RepID=A0AAW2YSI5_9EUKA
MPKQSNNCNILLLQDALERSQQDQDMQFNTAQQRVDLVRAERSVINNKVHQIIASGANIVISSEAIDSISLSLFARSNVIALRHVPIHMFPIIMNNTGAKPVKLYRGKATLGTCKNVIVETLPDGTCRTCLTGLNKNICTLVIQAPTNHAIQSHTVMIKKAVKVLKNVYQDCMIVPGGASVDIALCNDLIEIKHEHSRVIQSCVNALKRSCALVLCGNNDRILNQWINDYKENKVFVTPCDDCFVDVKQRGIWDSSRVKIQVLSQSFETVNVLLKIDCLIKASDLSKSALQRRVVHEEKPSKEDEPWSYQRYYPVIDKHISKREASRRSNKENTFYSEEKKEQRRLEESLGIQDESAKRRSRINQRLESLMHDRLREAGHGYQIDPFETDAM